MPDSSNSTEYVNECIVCGKPSKTQVCMHCFFNYDYRTYNSASLERQPAAKMNLDQWLEEVSFEATPKEVECYEKLYIDEDPPEPEEGNSWFPRLPRFS